MGIGDHVDQRHLADHRAEQFGPLHHHGGDQQPAIGAAHDAQLFGRGQAALDQVRRHRREIVIGALAVGLERRVMPGRPELAAAADIGHHIDAAMGQPQPPEIGAVAGRQRNLEAAIAIEHGGRRAVTDFWAG